MPNDPFIKKLDGRLKDMKAARSNFETTWQDVVDLVHPMGGDFTTQRSPGEERTLDIYDSTAREALLDSAGGMHSFLTNPAEQWFTLVPQTDDEAIRDNMEVKKYVQAIQREVYIEFASKKSGWGNMLSEVYPDTMGFGNAVMRSHWSDNLKSVRYRSYPLSTCYFEENSDGIIDVLFREFKWTKRQIMQEWPDVQFGPTDKGKKDNDKICVVHAVFPRKDADVMFRNVPSKARFAKNKSFAEVWYLPESHVRLHEGGQDSFPYHVARWQVLTGEIYGRGPVDTCMPDIRMLQRMERVGLRSIEKEVDPPMVVPYDGLVLPLQVDPGGVTLKEPGTDPIEYLQNPSKRIDVAFEKLEQKRQSIRQCLFVDLFRTQIKKERQTALEFQELRNESLRLIAPILARLQAEFLGKAIKRTIELLEVHTDRIPERPAILDGVMLTFDYNSAAARAQKALKADAISLFMQELAPMAQVRPEVFDKVDLDATVDTLAESRSIPVTILLDNDEVAQLRANRAQAQQEQALQQNAESLSQAAKNVADAQRL